MYIMMLIMLALINYCELLMQTIRVTVVDFFLSLHNTLANCVNKTLLFFLLNVGAIRVHVWRIIVQSQIVFLTLNLKTLLNCYF